jgi:hypothetical protein
MQGNASNSATLTMKLPKIVQRDFEPHFSLKHMLKDMQIASRYGLSQHLELGVTAAARDRLLEQMQKGHGDEDYSAVARKYFGEIRPASSEVADLELFEKPTPVEPFPFTSHETGTDTPVQTNADLPVSMPTTLPESVSVPFSPDALSPVDSSDIPTSTGALIEDLQSPPAAASNAEPDAPEEPLGEEERRRGLFSRLLRRTDY